MNVLQQFLQQMPFLSPKRQHQSTEFIKILKKVHMQRLHTENGKKCIKTEQNWKINKMRSWQEITGWGQTSIMMRMIIISSRRVWCLSLRWSRRSSTSPTHRCNFSFITYIDNNWLCYRYRMESKIVYSTETKTNSDFLRPMMIHFHFWVGQPTLLGILRQQSGPISHPL